MKNRMVHITPAAPAIKTLVLKSKLLKPKKDLKVDMLAYRPQCLLSLTKNKSKSRKVRRKTNNLLIKNRTTSPPFHSVIKKSRIRPVVTERMIHCLLARIPAMTIL